MYVLEEACAAWKQLENPMEVQARGSGIGAHALKATLCSEANLPQYKLVSHALTV